MNTMYSVLLAAMAMGMVLSVGAALGDDPKPTFDVWPGVAPGETADIGPEKTLPDKPGPNRIVRLTNVSKPTLTVWRAPKEKDTGAAVVICPGGGYSILAWDLEGEEVATWLNSIGVTGIILKYRVPSRKGLPRHVPPLQDAQRAMSLARSKAAEWGIDPKRIGMLGFSAGGNLTALSCTNFDQRAYPAIDDVDKIDCRPSFGVLVYPAWLVDDVTLQLKPEFTVTSKTPPMFMAHGGEDKITPINSVVMYQALKKAGVAAEVHVYAVGGHGFGLRPSTRPVLAWPKRCEEWMRSIGILPAP